MRQVHTVAEISVIGKPLTTIFSISPAPLEPQLSLGASTHFDSPR
jgi:hypothetical protein